mmetsp:Transcript_159845/g.512918  ORF Transcript_159845/g.512918 Transcript_159845/m.512918 type:complete len:217 (+) Transcript_159845:328-978(+)
MHVGEQFQTRARLWLVLVRWALLALGRIREVCRLRAWAIGIAPTRRARTTQTTWCLAASPHALSVGWKSRHRLQVDMVHLSSSIIKGISMVLSRHHLPFTRLPLRAVRPACRGRDLEIGIARTQSARTTGTTSSSPASRTARSAARRSRRMGVALSTLVNMVHLSSSIIKGISMVLSRHHLPSTRLPLRAVRPACRGRDLEIGTARTLRARTTGTT